MIPGAVFCSLKWILNYYIFFRFAFMHCIATSVSFWIYTIVNETIDYIVKKYLTKPISCDDFEGVEDDDGDDDENHSLLGKFATRGEERC